MKFPKEIKEAMQECILNVIWPKEDIIAFFKKNGCSKTDLVPIRKYSDLTRQKIVHLVFKQLSKRSDEGLMPFTAMNRVLLNWKHFNKYYFEELKKLKREDADKAISNLAEVQDYIEE
ncbi:MAG TPA: hypothetical protein QF753_00630 [Victivallales bacterium]|nr:hypothetical protein [Victivallales bacterium]